MKRVIGTIILIIAIICFGWSAFSLGKYAWQAHTTQKNIDQLADRINTDVTEASDDSDDSDEEDPVTESEAMMEKYGDLYNENMDFNGRASNGSAPISTIPSCIHRMTRNTICVRTSTAITISAVCFLSIPDVPSTHPALTPLFTAIT
ncbi:MAG: hypothetical protein ACLTDC_08845 [Lachnospiraceae bacterium]